MAGVGPVTGSEAHIKMTSSLRGKYLTKLHAASSSPAEEPSEESMWLFHRGIDVRGEEEIGLGPQLAGW